MTPFTSRQPTPPTDAVLKRAAEAIGRATMEAEDDNRLEYLGVKTLTALGHALAAALRCPTPHPEIRAALERATLHAPLTRALRFSRHSPHLVESLRMDLTRAASRHLSMESLLRAHLTITTELTGDTTHAMSMACLARFGPGGHPMPEALSRYGVAKSPWACFLADFAGEFSESQAFELASALARDASTPPPDNLLKEMASRDARLGCLLGAMRALPSACAESQALMAIDEAILNQKNALDEPDAPAWETLAQMALLHGARHDQRRGLLSHPQLAILAEAQSLADAAGAASRSKPAPRI